MKQTCQLHAKIKFENSEETSLCNKEIIWWTKVFCSIKRSSFPYRKFCYQLSQWKCFGLHQKRKSPPPPPPPPPPNSCALNPIDYAVLDVTGKMIRKNVKRYIEELSPAAFIGNCSCSSIEN